MLLRSCIVFIACSARIATAQVLDARSAAHLRDEYLADLDTVNAKITALAQAIPESRYSWRPSPGVRSVGEVIMHVATEYYFWGPHSIGAKESPEVANPSETIPKLELTSSKQEVLRHLKQSWLYMRAQVLAAQPEQLTGSYKPWNQPFAKSAFAMSGDLHEHLGQLIAYARSIGVTPPWTR